jgi:flagellar biogenesis protein FliO
MKRLLLLFLIFILIYLNADFAYSQQSVKQSDGKASSDIVSAEEEYLKYEPSDIPSMPNMFSASLRMITVLLVLLGLFFSVIFFLKKFYQRKTVQSSKAPINVLFQLTVGSKESICLVDVMGEILVLGITSAQISLLFKVEDVDALKSFQASQGQELRHGAISSGHQFVNHLKSEQENIKIATVLESLRALRNKLRKV